MKKALLTTAILLAFALGGVAQPGSFAPQGAEWYFNLSSFMGSPSSFYRMAVEGDTLIQGHTCSVITRHYLGGNGDKQFVYEDNGKVYWYNQTLQAFTTLYDFDAEVGDTWICDIDSCSFEVTVQSIEEVTWEGRTYRVQNIAPIEDEFFYFYYGRIIEGIGSVDGLFPYPYACVGDIYDGTYPDYLRCYLVDGEMLYHEGEYDCDEYGYCWDGTVAEAYAGGDGTAENPYQIATSEQLALLAYETNNGTGGDAYYVLTKDLSLGNCPGNASVEWTPIGMPVITANGGVLDTVPRFFTGHFDGQGHSIYDLRQIIDNGWFEPVGGLFGCTNGAEISNVSMIFCHVSGQGKYVGGLVGHAGLTDISNCSISSASSIKTEKWDGVAGGLIGYAGMPFGSHGVSEQTIHITNCSVRQAVTVKGSWAAGGIVGEVNKDYSLSQAPCEISNCATLQYYQSFYIQSEAAAGGIVGRIINGTITDCNNQYKVIGAATYGVGGIVGEGEYITVSQCTNGDRNYSDCGEVVGEFATGGIVGRPSSNAFLHVIGCTNYGTISGHNTNSGTFAGGIVGSGASLITSCVNKGNVSISALHSGSVGGIVGDGSCLVTNCYNRGDVTAAYDEPGDMLSWLFAGGIVGTPDAVVFNVYNTGTITGPDVSAFPDVLHGYGNIIGYGIEDCNYNNAYWLDNDIPACGNVSQPELHGSSAFHSGATSTMWQLDEPQYGTTDLLEALNYGAEALAEQYPTEPAMVQRWEYDNDNINDGFPVFGEIEVSYPFVGTEWYYEILNDNGSITYQHLEYAADTTVNNKDVKIIIRTNTLYDKGRHREMTREYIYESFGKVYWWNETLQDFTMLYDFGAQIGDEWVIRVGEQSLTMHVDTVEQYEYEGTTYRMLQVSDVDDLFSGTIVCGIGHLTSFFPERLMTRGKNFRVEGIRCHWREGELVFKRGDRDCDEVYQELHDGIDELSDGVFSIYPNPTSGILVVETQCFASQQAPTYRITNVIGQTLMSGTITTETQQIDVTNLPAGMYFITVGDATRKFVVR